jgi:hypothetical protein
VIEVQRDGRREKLPDVQAIAARSRRAAAVARQRPRREQEHQARRRATAFAGHPGFWTSDDTEAARRQANEFHYPHGHDQPTPRDLWQSRSPIHHTERERFHLTVQSIRSQMEEAMDPLARESLTAADQAAVHRRVVRQALIELGILSTHWRSITLPIRPRKLARIS